MNHFNHDSYYRMRAQASHMMARRATNPAIAAIHAEMATRYETKVAEIERSSPTARTAQAA